MGFTPLSDSSSPNTMFSANTSTSSTTIINGDGGNHSTVQSDHLLIDFDSRATTPTGSGPPTLKPPIIPLCLTGGDFASPGTNVNAKTEHAVAAGSSGFSPEELSTPTMSTPNPIPPRTLFTFTGNGGGKSSETANRKITTNHPDGDVSVTNTSGQQIKNSNSSISRILSLGLNTSSASNTSTSLDGYMTPAKGAGESVPKKDSAAGPPPSTDEEQISRNMTRLFVLADFEMTTATKALEKPSNYSVAFFEHLIANATHYLEELRKLVLLGNDGHFVLITKKMQHLREHLEALDQAKVILEGRKAKQQAEQARQTFCSPTPSTSYSEASSDVRGSGPLERLPVFDGDILNWQLFSSTYLALITKIPDPGAQFRLLYNHLDSYTRVRYLSDINPAAPEIAEVFRRIQAAFEDPSKVWTKLCISFNRLPPLKNVHSPSSWLTLLRAANLTSVLLNKHTTELAPRQAILVNKLLAKLPKKYENIFRDNINNDPSKYQLKIFAAYCDHNLAEIATREANGEPTEDKAIPEVLCPICDSDYHAPEDCEFDQMIRWEAIHGKGHCRRCLVERYSATHNCGRLCTRCGNDHHVALCKVLAVK